MSRLRTLSARAFGTAGALFLAATVAACEEDGKTVPERCADPPLPIYDIQTAGAPADDNARFNDGAGGEGGPPPCITEVGHAISSIAGGSPVGSPSGGNGAGGKAGRGAGGAGAGGASDAGAGGT